MNYLMLIVRLVHIFAGVYWVGATLTTSFYVGATTEGTGEAGRQVMQYLITKARLSTAMTAAAVLTVLAGYTLYWIDSNGFTSTWTHSGPGIGFGIGGAAGLLGLIFRVLANRNMATVGWLASEIKEQPTPEQSQKLGSIQKNQALLNKLNTWSLIVAVFFMATARYLVF
jgi:uncharacterized membrane protein